MKQNVRKESDNNTRRRTLKSEHISWLSAIDRITIAYCCWIIAYMILGFVFHRQVLHAEVHLPKYASIITGVILLAWADKMLSPKLPRRLRQLLRLLHGTYPVLLFGYFYVSLYSVDRILFKDWLDPWFMQIDHRIFGYYPSLEWGRNGGWLMQEFFHLAYFCFYPMIAGVPLLLYIKNRKAFREVIFDLTFVFYSCYFIYSLIPVIGGRFFDYAYQQSVAYQFGPFTHVMAYIYDHSVHWGGAFPSSHIAIAFVLTVGALKYLRKLGYVLCVVSLFLAIATVYCHYHWFVDAIAGIITGVAGYFIAGTIRAKLLKETT